MLRQRFAYDVGTLRSISMPTLHWAISRNAATGGLSRGIDLGRVALRQLTRAIRGGERQLKAVRNLLQAIFNGDAGHGGTFVGCGAILAERSTFRAIRSLIA